MDKAKAVEKKLYAMVKKFNVFIKGKPTTYTNWADVRYAAKQLPKRKQRGFFSKARKFMKRIKALDKKLTKLRRQ